ncbi:MAG: sialate O-acetylesterase [Chloroflexi bacterium]|nr:sialate O-acetylesterase [Chloroflexota bacterium]
MPQNEVGVILDAGISDWQVMQQDATGTGQMSLAGSWISDTPGRVQVRLASEETSVAANRNLDWQFVDTRSDHTWAAELTGIPAGGLYRLETRFNPDGNVAGEWSTRGDMRHFLGVGDLWVIAGQSNSAGYGRGPIADPPELGVHVLRNSEQWALATHPLNESTGTRHPVNREAANSGHSPYLHFARLLKQRLGYPIGLVPTALGGSALAPWNPGESESAVLFDNMVHCVQLTGGRVKGILWYQGESDANEQDSPTYARRFIQAAHAWREALHDDNLPVITVQLNRVHPTAGERSDTGWSLLREAQRQAPKMLQGIVAVPTLDLPLSDGIHISPAGNMLLADRLARAAFGSVYGLADAHLAPDVRSAVRAPDGASVTLRFDHVDSRMDTISPAANCFRVEDANGVAAVQKTIYPGDDTIQLALARPVVGGAVVHGAYGPDPDIVPMDMERFMPMLAFHGLAVE